MLQNKQMSACDLKQFYYYLYERRIKEKKIC